MVLALESYPEGIKAPLPTEVWIRLKGWMLCGTWPKLGFVEWEDDMTKVLFVRAEWDPDANVWVATSDDVPGLATEAETLELLSLKLDVMIPELLDANGYPMGPEVPFELLARKFSVVSRAAC
jgi:predicted RNase H-like HicB family nuclease